MKETNKTQNGKRVYKEVDAACFQRRAAIVERLNRTLKNIMWKYFIENNTDE